jgi:hypothetical protein
VEYDPRIWKNRIWGQCFKELSSRKKSDEALGTVLLENECTRKGSNFVRLVSEST